MRRWRNLYAVLGMSTISIYNPCTQTVRDLINISPSKSFNSLSDLRRRGSWLDDYSEQAMRALETVDRALQSKTKILVLKREADDSFESMHEIKFLSMELHSDGVLYFNVAENIDGLEVMRRFSFPEIYILGSDTVSTLEVDHFLSRLPRKFEMPKEFLDEDSRIAGRWKKLARNLHKAFETDTPIIISQSPSDGSKFHYEIQARIVGVYQTRSGDPVVLLSRVGSLKALIPVSFMGLGEGVRLLTENSDRTPQESHGLLTLDAMRIADFKDLLSAETFRLLQSNVTNSDAASKFQTMPWSVHEAERNFEDFSLSAFETVVRGLLENRPIEFKDGPNLKRALITRIFDDPSHMIVAELQSLDGSLTTFSTILGLRTARLLTDAKRSPKNLVPLGSGRQIDFDEKNLNEYNFIDQRTENSWAKYIRLWMKSLKEGQMLNWSDSFSGARRSGSIWKMVRDPSGEIIIWMGLGNRVTTVHGFLERNPGLKLLTALDPAYEEREVFFPDPMRSPEDKMSVDPNIRGRMDFLPKAQKRQIEDAIKNRTLVNFSWQKDILEKSVGQILRLDHIMGEPMATLWIDKEIVFSPISDFTISPVSSNHQDEP